MIRLLGAAMLLLGGLALGLTPVWELVRRARILGIWGEALLLLEGELSLSLPTMPQLMKTLSRKAPSPAGETFARVEKGLGKLGEQPFSQIWDQAVTESAGLRGEDLAPLLRLGEVLGRYDREERDRAVELARERLAHRESLCRETLRSKGRAYGTLGLAVGAFGVILLL